MNQLLHKQFLRQQIEAALMLLHLNREEDDIKPAVPGQAACRDRLSASRSNMDPGVSQMHVMSIINRQVSSSWSNTNNRQGNRHSQSHMHAAAEAY